MRHSGDDEFLRRYGISPAEAIACLHLKALDLTRNDRATAEDLVGELLRKLVEGPPPTRPVRCPKVYLRSALVRLWIDMYWRPRLTREVPRRDLPDGPSTAPSPERTAQETAFWCSVKEKVGPEDARLLYLYFGRGHTCAEIAATCGKPESTVSWRIRRAVEKLRTYLEGDQT